MKALLFSILFLGLSFAGTAQ
ncbi:MAG: hypothetical protein RJB25_1278, partial [Bacteroidota bacterium]